MPNNVFHPKEDVTIGTQNVQYQCIHQGMKKSINEVIEPLLQNFEMAVRFISAFLNAILA